MRPVIQGLVKIYSEKEHADKFLRGEMFARRLSWFRKLKGEDERSEDGRSDEYEGAAVLPKDESILNLEAHDLLSGEVRRIPTISGDDLANPLIIRTDLSGDIHLFCMYAFHGNDFQQTEASDIADYKEHLQLDERCLRLGAYTVAITDGREFIKRAGNAIVQQGYKGCCKLVEYYDPNVGVSIDSRSREVIFTKQEDLSYQREYRIAIDTGTTGCNPITLNIGAIHDIAFLMNTDDINRTLDIETRPPQ